MQKPGSDIVSVVYYVGEFGKVLSGVLQGMANGDVRGLLYASCLGTKKTIGQRENDNRDQSNSCHKEVEIDIKEGEQETKGPS